MHTCRIALALSLAFVTLLGPALGGCARHRARQASVVSRTYADTLFENHADVPVRLTIWACERSPKPPGIGATFRDVPRVLAPGEKYKALVKESRPYGVGFLWPEESERVIRIRLERLGATWETPAAAWYEVVGPLPKLVTIHAGESSDQPFGAPVATSEEARIELVPREWWPTED